MGEEPRIEHDAKQVPYNHSRLIVIGLIIASVSLFSGCKNPSKENEAKTPPTAELDPNKDVIKELSGYDVPTSYEITTHIYEAGVRYSFNFPNGPEKAGDYITQRDKVLNLCVCTTVSNINT